MNTQSAIESPTTPEGWLSVAAFATARGCSIRTVKRWIESGEVATRKDGARRFVRPLGEGTQSDTQGTRQKGHAPEVVSLLRSVHAQSQGHKGHAQGTQRDTEGTLPVSLSLMNASEREVQLRADLERERELNGFLRGLIEGHQRSEAELRAALREALKIAPRQLSAGATSGEQLTQVNAEKSGGVGTSWDGHASARNAQSEPQNGEADRDNQQAASGGEIAPEREETPVSYGSIADELERMLNR